MPNKSDKKLNWKPGFDAIEAFNEKGKDWLKSKCSTVIGVVNAYASAANTWFPQSENLKEIHEKIIKGSKLDTTLNGALGKKLANEFFDMIFEFAKENVVQ